MSVSLLLGLIRSIAYFLVLLWNQDWVSHSGLHFLFKAMACSSCTCCLSYFRSSLSWYYLVHSCALFWSDVCRRFSIHDQIAYSSRGISLRSVYFRLLHFPLQRSLQSKGGVGFWPSLLGSSTWRMWSPCSCFALTRLDCSCQSEFYSHVMVNLASWSNLYWSHTHSSYGY